VNAQLAYHYQSSLEITIQQQEMVAQEKPRHQQSLFHTSIPQSFRYIQPPDFATALTIVFPLVLEPVFSPSST
jgi:hypothetical protein